jgi:ABC-2 type transport system permease protein
VDFSSLSRQCLPRCRSFTYVLPLRYISTVIRDIMLKGVGLRILYQGVLSMVVFGLFIMVLAALRFRKRLE